MKIKKARIASPDDPIYKEGWQTFSMHTENKVDVSIGKKTQH